jgi:hypothetical protein
MSNQAGWECDACRKAGLETKRNCGWLGGRDEDRVRPVWVRKRVAISTCPKSYVTGDSLAAVEEFFGRKRVGGIRVEELSAKQVEAFAVLENEYLSEVRDAERAGQFV